MLPHRGLFIFGLVVSQVVVATSAWNHEPRALFGGLFGTVFGVVGLLFVGKAQEAYAYVTGINVGADRERTGRVLPFVKRDEQ